MSVLIRGLEMPKSCHECRFYIENIHDRGDCSLCRASGKEVKCGCPLIEVPTPHGRLIDADALYNVFLGLAQDEWNRNTNCTWGAGFAEAMEITEDAPTIIQIEDGE